MATSTGTELAAAYVSIIPSTRGMKKTLEQELGQEVEKVNIDKKSKTLGSKVMGGLKKGMLGAAASIGGVLSGALLGGFNRLKNIENAEAKLTGLGHSAESVQQIMTNALKSVQGTAFGLDEAGTVAAGVVAAGIKPGKATSEYIDSILTRITLPGAIYLALVAIFPSIAVMLGVTTEFSQFFGGTSLIIMVGVVLDTLQQVESYLLMRHYDGMMKSGKLRGRTENIAMASS